MTNDDMDGLLPFGLIQLVYSFCMRVTSSIDLFSTVIYPGLLLTFMIDIINMRQYYTCCISSNSISNQAIARV